MEELQLLFIEKEASIDIRQSIANQFFKNIRSVSSYTKALTEIEEYSPDLIIVDLELKGKFDGFDSAEQLYEQYNIPYIFCSSANVDPEINELISGSNALGFLKKPFSVEDLLTVVGLALNNYGQKIKLKKQINRMRSMFHIQDNEPYIFIRSDYQLQKINLKDIIYVEAVKDYVHIHCTDQVYSTHATMKKMEQMLPDHQFLRIHRSSIVRLDRIVSIKYPKLYLHHIDEAIMIGGLYRKALFEKIPIV